ncbi:MAG: glycosyltransferase [Anaerolineales bacterium]
MKVLIITTAFPRWYGDGRGAFIYEAAQAIKRQGCEVRVIAMHVPGAKTHEWMDGIEVIRPRYLPERWEILAKDSAGLPQAWRTNPWAKLALIPFLVVHTIAVLRYAREADILHANWTLSGMVAWLTQWLHHKPYVVTVHGSDVFQGLEKPMVYLVSKICLEEAGAVISVSKALAQRLHEKKIFPVRIEIITNGINFEEIVQPINSYGKRNDVILFVGSIFWRKGVIYLLEAFADISVLLPNYRLILIGEGDQVHELKKKVIELKLENRVEFKGALPHQEVIGWMQRSKVLVLPSVEEGQGVVLLESMACGTPCIGSNVGGIPEIVNSDNGWLVPPGDVKALKEALIDALLISEEQWGRKSVKALETVRNFSWDKVAQKIISVYEDLIE